MWEEITAEPQANSISIGDLLAKNNPAMKENEITFFVTEIEQDGKIVIESQKSAPQRLAQYKVEATDLKTKKYPTELIDERWWLKTS